MRATGVEIMPVGVLAGTAIAEAANGVSKRELESEGARLLDVVTSRDDAPSEHAFPHVRITEAAFPAETESAIARAREFLGTIEDDSIRTMLDFACMSVLEAVSYTRKDGQYLRWDYRSGRALRARVNKGPILPYAQALGERLFEMLQDMEPLKQEFGGTTPTFLTGSSLELLRGLPSGSFDMVMTSPPYANRYDYTRTYALELAWLGYDNDDFSALRQQCCRRRLRTSQSWNGCVKRMGPSQRRSKRLLRCTTVKRPFTRCWIFSGSTSRSWATNR